jgi:hypothetical protein
MLNFKPQTDHVVFIDRVSYNWYEEALADNYGYRIVYSIAQRLFLTYAFDKTAYHNTEFIGQAKNFDEAKALAEHHLKANTPETGLQFDYCECGCHGHSASLCHLNFWIYCNPSSKSTKNPYQLFKGHGFSGQCIGNYSTFENATEAANKLCEAYIEELEAQIAKFRGESK